MFVIQPSKLVDQDALPTLVQQNTTATSSFLNIEYDENDDDDDEDFIPDPFDLVCGILLGLLNRYEFHMTQV